MGEILTRIERTYLRIGTMQMRHKSVAWVEQHYAHLINQDFFPQLTAFMTARPILGFSVIGPHAIERMRALAGPTESWKAAPGTIRGDMGGNPAMYNLIHVSDSQESSDREFKLFMDLDTDLEFDHASATMPERR